VVGEGRDDMSKRLRTIAVAVLAGVLMVSSIGAAFAFETTDVVEDVAMPDLETVKEKVLEGIENRIDRFEDALQNLEGKEGVRAEQLAALVAEGIAIFEQLTDDVAEASSVEEIIEAIRAANREYRSLRRVRNLYAHVQNDIDKFTRRVDRLEGAIERAEDAGADVTEAALEAVAATADLESAQVMLDGIDPSDTGEEIVEALKEAHQTAHSGQRHMRAGWKALLEALPPG
jgi:predicted ribosome quality control (RQC) complex YloA/Tae2 family protein